MYNQALFEHIICTNQFNTAPDTTLDAINRGVIKIQSQLHFMVQID